MRHIDVGHGLGAVRLQAVVELLEVVGVGESTTRVVLARMRREGWFESRREGRQTVYALTDRSWRLLDDGQARIFERTSEPWDGAWRTVIYAVPEAERAERETVRRTLAWHGFGPLAASTWVSPHARLDAVAEGLADLSATRVDLLVSRARSPEADRAMVARCWDLQALGREYADLVAELAALDLAETGAAALRTQLVLLARWRTLPFRDPELPAALLPEGWLGTSAHAQFLAAHDTLHGPAGALVREIVDRHG